MSIFNEGTKLRFGGDAFSFDSRAIGIPILPKKI